MDILCLWIGHFVILCAMATLFLVLNQFLTCFCCIVLLKRTLDLTGLALFDKLIKYLLRFLVTLYAGNVINKVRTE